MSKKISTHLQWPGAKPAVPLRYVHYSLGSHYQPYQYILLGHYTRKYTNQGTSLLIFNKNNNIRVDWKPYNGCQLKFNTSHSVTP